MVIKKSKITSKTPLLLLVGLATILANGTGQAATDEWRGTTSSDWSTGSNWNLGLAPTSVDQARFGYSAQSTPTLGAGLFTVQKLYFVSSGVLSNYNFTGAGSANTTLKIDPNSSSGVNFIENAGGTSGGINQTFSNLTLLLEDSNLTGQTKIAPGDGRSITIASNATLQIGSTTAQAVILEANGSTTGSGALTINGVLIGGVTGSSIKADTSGVLNLNLAAGSSLANIQLSTGTGGVINFVGGGNLGGSVNPSAGRVNLATSGITIGSTTSFAFGTAGTAGNSTIGATYTSGTSTIEGQVALTGGGGAARNNIFDVAGGGTLIMSGLLTGGNTASTSVSKTGTGTLSLTKSTGNSISGSAFNVSAGTLLVNNTTGSATGTLVPVNVAVGATLAGAGRIEGATTISGILAPGNSIGTLRVANDVTWNGSLLGGGATTDWQFELGAANTADLLQITGAASEFIKGTGTTFRFDFLGSTATGTFKLVDWESITSVGGGVAGTSFAATDFTYTNLGGGNSGTFQFNGSQLEFQAVPEPSSLVMLIGGGVCLILVRRFGRTAV
jgi:fibronectin-binding autotransporter adhesin